MCNLGASDCNKNTAPDLDGCECATPSCCGTSCQTTHQDGVGQSYFDCNALGIHNSSQALEACTAYALTQGKTANACTDLWNCSAYGGGTINFVCFSASPGTCTNFCWQYAGPEQGWVTSCANCTGQSGVWN
jgi:hypothetical protein